MTNYGPIVRIILRYIAGGLLMGSAEIGQQLATDPDLVAIGSLILAGAVEAYYAWAKRTGGRT